MLKKSRILAGVLGCFLLMDLHAASLDSLSQRLARGANSLKNKKVAVLTFPYHDGKLSSGSSIVSERLTTLLVGKRGIRVIERRLIKQLLAEKKLSETGLINPESLKAMASVLNVDALVTGTLIDLGGGQTEINARMILADSGEVLAAAQEIIARTWKDEPAAPRVKEPVEPPSPTVNLKKKEEKTEKEAEGESSPKPSTGKNLRFSNESFPAGRRRYLSNNPAPKRRTTNSHSYEQKRRENDHDSSYEDGYYDAVREAQGNNGATYQNTGNSNKYNSSSQSTLQHPTEVGVIRSDSYTDPYGNYNYKSDGAKSRNSR